MAGGRPGRSPALVAVKQMPGLISVFCATPGLAAWAQCGLAASIRFMGEGVSSLRRQRSSALGSPQHLAELGEACAMLQRELPAHSVCPELVQTQSASSERWR